MPDGSPIRTHGTRKNSKMVERLVEKPELRLGWCKWFNVEKGYGFITPENPEEPDVFVHNGSVTFAAGNRNIGNGQDLEYLVTKETKDGKESIRATEVTAPGGRPVPGPQVAMPTMQMQMGTLLGKRTAGGPLLGQQRGGGVSLLNMQQGGVKRIQLGHGMGMGKMQQQNMQQYGGQYGAMRMMGQPQQQRNPYQKYL